MNALIVLLVIVALTACGSKDPTQSLESPKTIATTQGMCPLDIVGQWQREVRRGPPRPPLDDLIFHLCEDGTWTNWNGFSGVWALDDNTLTIGNETASSTGHIFLSRDTLYLNFTGDQFVRLVLLFRGSKAAEGLDVEPDARIQVPFSRVYAEGLPFSDRFTIVVLSTRGTTFLLDKETGEVWSLHSVRSGEMFVKVPVR